MLTAATLQNLNSRKDLRWDLVQALPNIGALLTLFVTNIPYGCCYRLNCVPLKISMLQPQLQRQRLAGDGCLGGHGG